MERDLVRLDRSRRMMREIHVRCERHDLCDVCRKYPFNMRREHCIFKQIVRDRVGESLCLHAFHVPISRFLRAIAWSTINTRDRRPCRTALVPRNVREN